MSRMFFHGSGMLNRIPIGFGDWKWDSSQAWVSVLELGSRKPEFQGKLPEDYLVVEFSYLTESSVVRRETGEIYTWNKKNLADGLVSETDKYFRVMTEPAEAFKKEFDGYIRWISSQFPPEKIILVRTVCPDRCLSGAFLHRYFPVDREAFEERCRFFEEYFMEQVSCTVVDIARDFPVDGNDMRYGLYVSYERLFYRNMGKIIRGILSGKSREKYYRQSEYRLALRRYLAFYPAAYRRREEELLLERSSAVNCLVRALNPAMIEEHEDFLIALEQLKCSDYTELLSRGDFSGHRELEKLVVLLREFEEEKYTLDSLEVLKPFWGVEAGIERQVQEIVWKYYEEQAYLGRHLIPLMACQALYTAMVYLLAGDYRHACESVRSAKVCLAHDISCEQNYSCTGKESVGRFFPGGLLRRKESGRDFRKLVSEYGIMAQTVGVDVWGNRMTKQIFSGGNACYISHEISADVFNEKETAEKMEMLWSNSASMLVFDIYWTVSAVGDEFSEEDVKARIDAFVQFASQQYGKENIVLHWIVIKTEYLDEKGEKKELPSAALLRRRAQLLERYQRYLTEKYRIDVIAPEGEHTLCDRSEVAVFGINYRREYFEDVCVQWEKWLQRRRVGRVHGQVCENFITAYPMMNLGDDLFIDMLVTRYPEQHFTLYVKNQRLRDCYNRYENLEVCVCDDPSALEECHNHILIGGSMFIENVGWGMKLLSQRHVKDCARNNYLLGANFGPYDQEEYLEEYRELLKEYRDVCFREAYSGRLFGGGRSKAAKAVKVAKATSAAKAAKPVRTAGAVRTAPDIVFGYRYGGTRKSREQVVLSVLQLKGRRGLEEFKELYDSRMAELCREFLQAGSEVVLMSFCRGEGDEQAVRDICERLEESERERLHIHCYLGDNLDSTLEILAESRWVVGSRFHAVVLGFALEKTVYPVIYSDKTKHMLQDIGFEGEHCTIPEIGRLTRRAVLDNEKYPIETEQIKRDAQMQFQALDRLFGRGVVE